MSRAWLALGSNLGNRDRYLARARTALAGAGVHIVRESRVAETAPVGITDQPAFLNQVLEVETALDPRPLLQTVKRIEQDLGRQPRLRWGPREIDIDEPGLHIPHAELQNRPFLLDLLTEISA